MRVGNLLRLYPRTWRERYGEEFELILAQQRASPRLLLDVVAGAIDARLNPQPVFRQPAETQPEGKRTMSKFLPSCSAVYSTADHRRSIAWLIGGTLALTAIAVTLEIFIGENVVTEAFGYSAFPMALVFSSHCTYMKPYSRASKTVIMAVTAALVFAVMLTVTMATNLL